MTLKTRQQKVLRQIQSDKRPYIVRGAPGLMLYLTDEQATKRLDLIPQFLK